VELVSWLAVRLTHLAACGVTGLSVSMVMASECARSVGMRTAVQLASQQEDTCTHVHTQVKIQ
jgi:hypothetical protein